MNASGRTIIAGAVGSSAGVRAHVVIARCSVYAANRYPATPRPPISTRPAQTTPRQ